MAVMKIKLTYNINSHHHQLRNTKRLCIKFNVFISKIEYEKKFIIYNYNCFFIFMPGIQIGQQGLHGSMGR